MAISDDELKLLVEVTGAFEASGDPYLGVSGDFDGQGISCGVLQWNVGQKSLQPLVIAVGKSVVISEMPTHGANLWKACNSSIGEALAIVRAWQTGTVLKPGPRGELKRLMGSSAMRKEQDKGVRKIAAKAEDLANAWAIDRGTGSHSLQELVWFFDIVTQSGSMKKLSFEDVVAFKKAAGPGRADDLVCDWLAATTKKYAGMKDCHQNAILWRNQVDGVGLDLLVLSYLRSQKSTLTWRGDVLNRKGTLAAKFGFVHGSKFDFSSKF